MVSLRYLHNCVFCSSKHDSRESGRQSMEDAERDSVETHYFAGRWQLNSPTAFTITSVLLVLATEGKLPLDIF